MSPQNELINSGNGENKENATVNNIEKTNSTSNTQRVANAGGAQGTTNAGNAQRVANANGAQGTANAGNTQRVANAGGAQGTTNAGNAQRVANANGAQGTTNAGGAQSGAGGAPSAANVGNAQRVANAGNAQGTANAGGAQKQENKPVKNMDWSKYSNPHNTEWYKGENESASNNSANSNSNADAKSDAQPNSKRQTQGRLNADEKAAIKQEEQFIKQSERIAKKAKQASEKSENKPEFEKLTLQERELQEQQGTLRKMRFARRRRQFTGIVALMLMVVGIVAIFSTAANMVTNAFDDTELLEEYSERVRYVVALDSLPFEDINEAPLTTLLFAAMSHAIVTSDDLTQFEYNEIGALYLPISIVNESIDELYGPEIQFNFADFTLNGLEFFYDAQREAYLMPITSVPTDFAPIAQELRRSGDTHVVTIGYDVPYDTVIQPIKYNDFVFTRHEDGNYYLSAIRTSQTTVQQQSSSVPEEVEDTAPAVEQDTADIFNEALDETMTEQTSTASGEQTEQSQTSTASGEQTEQSQTSTANGEQTEQSQTSVVGGGQLQDLSANDADGEQSESFPAQGNE